MSRHLRSSALAGGAWLAAAGLVATWLSESAALAAAPNSLVLNEANTVSGTSYLDEERPAGPRPRADLTLGRIQGNGENWFEFLVVQGDELGSGQFANTLDVRGWKIAWSYHKKPVVPTDPDPNQYGSGIIQFSEDPVWTAVPRGTLITFNEWQETWYHDAGTDPAGFGGLQKDGGINGLGVQTGDPFDSGVHQKRFFNTDTKWNPFSTSSDGVSAGQTGDWRIHVWAGERNPDTSFKYFNFTGSIVDGDPLNPIPIGMPETGLYAVNNDSWEFTILEPIDSMPDKVIQGPIGEDLSAGAFSVGADELLRFENFPIRTPPATQANYLNATIADYIEGTSSAYGVPNVWSGGTFVQDLSSLRNWVRAGDVNLDGRVNASDFLVWQRNLGATNASFTQGDLNADGTVNNADLAVWKTTFGMQSAGGAATAIPECSSFALAALAACASRTVRRRRRSGGG